MLFKFRHYFNLCYTFLIGCWENYDSYILSILNFLNKYMYPIVFIYSIFIFAYILRVNSMLHQLKVKLFNEDVLSLRMSIQEIDGKLTQVLNLLDTKQSFISFLDITEYLQHISLSLKDFSSVGLQIFILVIAIIHLYIIHNLGFFGSKYENILEDNSLKDALLAAEEASRLAEITAMGLEDRYIDYSFWDMIIGFLTDFNYWSYENIQLFFLVYISPFFYSLFSYSMERRLDTILEVIVEISQGAVSLTYSVHQYIYALHTQVLLLLNRSVCSYSNVLLIDKITKIQSDLTSVCHDLSNVNYVNDNFSLEISNHKDIFHGHLNSLACLLNNPEKPLDVGELGSLLSLIDSDLLSLASKISVSNSAHLITSYAVTFFSSCFFFFCFSILILILYKILEKKVKKI